MKLVWVYCPISARRPTLRKKYLVTLTAQERQQLQALLAGGKAAAKKLTHARILLKADQASGGPAWEDARIGEALDVGHRTVGRVPQRYDYEYVGNGTANLFMVCEPQLGWPAVQVTQRRTARDFAEVLPWLVEQVHPDALKVVLVLDNRNRHQLASLSGAFPAEQARRMARRLEIHYTPKYGSWR